MVSRSPEILHTFDDGGQICGFVDSRFERVFETFLQNFAARGELGGSVCITLGGETVVDLWGGFAAADRETAWEADTICMAFSATKGIVALCTHMLVSRGLLDLDMPVADIWPEFACNGKESALVSMALDHSIGVPVIREPVRDVTKWDEMVDQIAAHPAFWEPGERLGYHALTYGWIVGEIFRRVAGKSVGAFLREELAGPLDADFYIGLPADHNKPIAKLNRVKASANAPMSRFLRTAMNDPESLAAKFLFNGGVRNGNDPDYQAAEVPAANGMGNARGLARLYAPFSVDGKMGGKTLIDRPTFERMVRVSMASRLDATLLIPNRFSLGFIKSLDNRGLKTDPPTDSAIIGDAAFGHPGMGGSIAFADPDLGMSFAYVMNNLGTQILLNDRGQALVDAAYLSAGYRSNASGAWTR